MSYRDSFEKCPRCGVELADARSARGCPACGGLWVQEAVLTEMVQEMLPPGPLVRLQLAVLERGEAPLGCPSCGDKMEQTTLLQVPIERCAKHGVWFDANELGTALHRVTTALQVPVVVDTSPPPPRRARPRPPIAAPPPPPSSVHDVAPGQWYLDFLVHTAGHEARVVRVTASVIKLGRLKSAHVLVEDPAVARMHAVIESEKANVAVIDLGSEAGTWVNGARINKAKLEDGDEIVMGSTKLTVMFPE